MSAPPSTRFLVALAAIAFIAPLAIHSYLPVLPAVQSAFGISSAQAGVTFSITLFVMACTTLIYGSLSDRYGRRRVLLAGLALFVAGSALSALAESFAGLVAGRVIQAIGAGAAVALNRAIAHDAYGPDQLVKVIAYLTMAYTLGPMTAPFIAGVLIEQFGWRSTFWLATIAGAAIVAAAWSVLHETRPAGTKIRGLASMLREYVVLMRNPRFAAFVLQTGFSTGAFMAMAAAAAYLMIDYLGRSPSEFGRYFLLCPLGYFCGNLIASRLSGRVAVEPMVLAGTLLMTVAIAVQSGLILAGHIGPLEIFVPGAVLTFAQGLAMPNAQTGAMRLAPGAAGTAAGIAVFCQMFLGAVGVEAYALLADGTPTPMVIAVLTGTVLGLVAGVAAYALPRPAASG